MDIKTLALYLGCKAQLSFSDEPDSYEVTIDCAALKRLEDFPDETALRPILRPLSSINIEEAAWCLKETFFDHVDYPLNEFKLELVGDGNPRISIDNDWFKESLTFGNKRGSIWSVDRPSQNVKIQPKIFIYLLSKGFDLFGLIEKGEAIDSTTLTPTP